MCEINNCLPLFDYSITAPINKAGAAVSLATLVATVIAPQIFGAYALYFGAVAAVTFIATVISAKVDSWDSLNMEMLSGISNKLRDGQKILYAELYFLEFNNGHLIVRRQDGNGSEFHGGDKAQEQAVFAEVVEMSKLLGLKGQLRLSVSSSPEYIQLYVSLGMEIDNGCFSPDITASWRKDTNGKPFISMKMSEAGLKRWSK